MPGTLGAKERWVATGSVAALVGGMVVGEVLHKNGAQGVVGAQPALLNGGHRRAPGRAWAAVLVHWPAGEHHHQWHHAR